MGRQLRDCGVIHKRRQLTEFPFSFLISVSLISSVIQKCGLKSFYIYKSFIKFAFLCDKLNFLCYIIIHRMLNRNMKLVIIICIQSKYGISHGHAVALNVRKLFPYMVEHVEECSDPRGAAHLKDIFNGISIAMGCNNGEEASNRFCALFDELEFSVPMAKDEDFKIMNSSVNPIRLKNNPVALDKATIDMLYHQIVR